MDLLSQLAGRARGLGISLSTPPRGDIVLNDPRDEQRLRSLARSLGWRNNGTGLSHPQHAMHVNIMFSTGRRSGQRSHPFI